MEIGRQIQDYVIVNELGAGGMGAVYEARHRTLGRSAAIKVLHPHIAADERLAFRFVNEGRAASVIDHPGVVEVYDCGRLPDGTVYLIMELLRGESLGRRLRRVGRLPPPEALSIGHQVAVVLAAAHARGVVHRDLKPDNVMLVPDAGDPRKERVKLLDFGIAHIARERESEEMRTRLTQTDQVLGTPRYMAPEQCRGAKHVDDKADVYALGAMFYELLAGRTPFQADSTGELMLQHMQATPRSLREIDPSLPAGFAVLIHAMLAKSPDERPSALEVLAELDRIADALARRDHLAAPPRDEGAALEVPSHSELFRELNPLVKVYLALALVCVLFAIGIAVRFHLPL
jgi:serine/threonine-protein kinase